MMTTAEGREAAEETELLELLEFDESKESLSDFIRRVSPHHPPPRHIGPLIAALERARRERVRLVVAMPPRHVKTHTILHAFAWWMTQSPADTHAYCSYSDDQAASKSALVRDLAVAAGVELRSDSTAKHEWRNLYGGGLIASGVGGALTGKGVSGLLVVDDPIKNREEAESDVHREKTWTWFTDVAQTRSEGASTIVVMTRWHQDDLSGRLIDAGWEYLNLAALAEVEDPDNGFPADPLGRAPGEALWPENFPATSDAPACKAGKCGHSEHLDVIAKAGVYSFASLYQGRPRPRGDTVFGAPTYYDPASFSITGKQIVIYADTAASKKTSADHSVLIAIAMEGRKPHERMGWVLEVDRHQRSVPTFMNDLRAFQARHGNTVANIEAVGMAKAIPDMMELIDPGSVTGDEYVQGDKFTRAQPAAAAWNQGRLLVPIDAPWLKAYLREMQRFTGVNDAEDDQVDATSGAWNSYEPKAVFQGSGGSPVKRRV